MIIKASAKFIRLAPRKVRLVANMVMHERLSPKEAIIALNMTYKSAAKPLIKVIKSAIANAVTNNNLSADDLSFKSILITQGPTLKRFKAGSRGIAKPIRKRTSHITVILESSVEEVKTKQKIKKKSVTKDQKKAIKTDGKKSKRVVNKMVDVETVNKGDKEL